MKTGLVHGSYGAARLAEERGGTEGGETERRQAADAVIFLEEGCEESHQDREEMAMLLMAPEKE